MKKRISTIMKLQTANYNHLVNNQQICNINSKFKNNIRP